MKDKFLAPVLEAAGKAVVRGATALEKAVNEHFVKHGFKHLFGGDAPAAGGADAAVGVAAGGAALAVGAAAGGAVLAVGAAAGGAVYAVGEAVGHSKGKKEGTTEQAARDEKKIKEMHQQHENDRKRWNEEKQAYEDLLDETEKKL